MLNIEILSMSHDQTFQMATSISHHRMTALIHAAKKRQSCFGSLILCCKKMVILHQKQKCQSCISFVICHCQDKINFSVRAFDFFQNIWTHGWNSKWSPSKFAGEDSAGKLRFHEVIQVLQNVLNCINTVMNYLTNKQVLQLVQLYTATPAVQRKIL